MAVVIVLYLVVADHDGGIDLIAVRNHHEVHVGGVVVVRNLVAQVKSVHEAGLGEEGIIFL